MDNLLDALKSAVDKFSKDLYDATEICLANPKTLLSMNMSEIPGNIWFISQEHIKDGNVVVITDAGLKREVYKFCEEHPDRFFKGKKSF